MTTIGELIQRPPVEASRDYIHTVARELELDDATAEKVADYITRETERIGGSDARLVFLLDGGGPLCSWCWAIGGHCAHIAGGASEHVHKPKP